MNGHEACVLNACILTGIINSTSIKVGISENTYICEHCQAAGSSGRFYIRQKTSTAMKEKEDFDMKRYVCEPCGYVYDPEEGDPDGGIEPGTAFEDIPDDWVCPICGLGKDVFVEEE